MRGLRRLMALVSGVAMLPFLAILATVALAALFGCDVNEGGPQACMVLGTDWGGFLSGLLAFGWLGLLTIPFLMGIFLVWLSIEAFVWWRKRRKARRQNANEAA
jgi:hypothetical protein